MPSDTLSIERERGIEGTSLELVILRSVPRNVYTIWVWLHTAGCGLVDCEFQLQKHLDRGILGQWCRFYYREMVGFQIGQPSYMPLARKFFRYPPLDSRRRTHITKYPRYLTNASNINNMRTLGTVQHDPEQWLSIGYPPFFSQLEHIHLTIWSLVLKAAIQL
jgi:hypothetical protein